MAASRALRRLPMGNLRAQIFHQTCDFNSGACRFGSTVDLISEAAFVSLHLIVQTEDGVEDRNALFERDSLQSVGYGVRQVFGMIGLAFQNDAQRKDGVWLLF